MRDYRQVYDALVEEPQVQTISYLLIIILHEFNKQMLRSKNE